MGDGTYAYLAICFVAITILAGWLTIQQEKHDKAVAAREACIASAVTRVDFQTCPKRD